MSVVIEEKEYGPDSSEQEITALRSRVYLYRPNVIYWQEIPIMSCWQVELLGHKLTELIQDLDNFSLLVDLTNSKPPNAQVRQSLRKVFGPLKNQEQENQGLIKISVFTGRNFLINVAAKFVMGGLGLPFSVHSTQCEAELALGIKPS
jgi:hypothetical protein